MTDDTTRPAPEEPPAMYTLDQWTEEDGAVLWWFFPIVEPPYCGTPSDIDWPWHHTHWTRFHVPEEPK